MKEIIIDKLSKSYGNKTVFKELSLSVSLEGITVIMGESGCGKTTLLRILAGLEKSDSGTVTGVPEKISFMFQEDRLLEWYSAFENVKLVSDETDAEKYLDAVELANDKNTAVSQLSGGMKRRVALARALAYSSQLVILDEPFKGMDIELKQNMMELVKKESASRAFIVVAHEPQEAEFLADRLIKL